MRRDELIINGEAVDLSADVVVSLDYVNNLLGAVDKISASHSYTIKLPHTLRNERIFDYPTPAHASKVVGRYLPAEYRRGGITIVRNARAYVSGVTADGLSVCLLWDALAPFSEWLARGESLRDLPFSDVVWQRGTDSADYGGAVVRASYDTGVDPAIMPPPPCVRVRAIFEDIGRRIMAPWRVDVPGMLEEMDRLVLPLMTREGAVQPDAGGTWQGVDTGELDIYGRLPVIPTQQQSGMMQTDGATFEVASNVASLAISVSGTWTVAEVTEGAEAELDWATLCIYPENYAGGVPIETVDMTLAGDYAATVNATVEIPATGDFIIAIETGNGDVVRLSGEGSITIVPTTRTATPGGLYNVAANMPDISQVNFLKAVCAIFGAQLINDKDGTLVFVSVASYYDKAPVDWSGKLVNYDGTPERIAFTVGDYARKNWLRYKEDGENGGADADGAFFVDNDTLKAEKDAATLPFAATRGNRIEHYSAKYDDSAKAWTVEDKKVAPRILRTYTAAGNTLGARFDASQTFPAIISQWYAGLQRLLRRPVEIAVYMRLDELDLSTLDLARPVYLRQTGAAYIIKEINTDTITDICEVTLIQL